LVEYRGGAAVRWLTLALLLTGCATRIPGHVIVTHRQGQVYCLYGVQLDSHYRCVDEAGPGLPPSAVHHIE
jgi:hypothetical protein